MPHYQCKPCRTRLSSAAGPTDLVGDLCPGCGSLLEPVGDLAEIVGFQAIQSSDGAADGNTPDRHERIAGRVDDFLAHRTASLARARLDAERWVDDGGSFRAEAVALPPPQADA